MWQLVVISGIVLTALYCLLILLYLGWYVRLKPFLPPSGITPQTSFSIIIPARNEAGNIAECIRSIAANDYPAAYEIIVVDDFSTDETPDIVRSLQATVPFLKLVQLKDVLKSPINSYKKKAITTAIDAAAYEWIITTDADCTIPQNWLQLADAFIQTVQPVFIAAPVVYRHTGSFLSAFQCLDFLSLQGITAASVSAGFHSMCNGANLAYSKTAFHAVDGFANADHIASGDDMLLMHKISARFPGQIGYLHHRGAIVSTQPEPSLTAFIRQRVRWASKATSYTDRKIFAVLVLVYFFNLYLVVLPLTGIFFPALLYHWVIFLAVKTATEMMFMTRVATFFRQQRLLWWFPFMQPFHLLYTVVSGLLGKFSTYQWKGRSVR